ncbi:DUF6414 family protein [Psychrobacter aquimaris]|uniref:DUF6414 family protein n=1 Tax=Psychrobacter aquimaris TaxID=292733 RepID=UPI003FD54434
MIKNIIYLDEDKMYSLSSQLFEGVTEYVLNEKNLEKSESEQQKGSMNSGRIVGDILKNSERNTEKKFLNDYSYTLFEQKLIEEDKVIITSNTSNDFEKSLGRKSFIKIKAKVTFNDINSIIHTFSVFNELGKALTYVTTFEDIESLESEIVEAKKIKNDKSRVSELEAELKKLKNIDKLAIESGLKYDNKFLQNLNFLLEYGLKDQFEVEMKLPNRIVSANLNRDFLRGSEDLLIRKYSRETEVEFTLFGIVTQYEKEQLEIPDEEKDYENMKDAMMHIVAHMTNLESAFTGRRSNEIIIDPIAMYTEL